MGIPVNNRCATGAPNAGIAVRGGTKSGTSDARAHRQRSLPVPVTQAISVATTTTSTKQNLGAEFERGVWIMRDLPAWLTGPAGTTTLRQLRNLARMLPGTPRERAQAIIVLSPSSDVPPELAGHATVIEWPLPDRVEIAAILDAAIESLPDDLKVTAAPNGTRDAAIDAAIGLSGEEAQACYARSLVQHRRIDPATVAKEKRRVIARERVLEWYDPIPGGLDAVGGLDNLKTWLKARGIAYSPQARAYGLPAPKGALLAGIPGCLRGDTRVLLADGRMPTLEQLARQVSDCLIPGEYDVAHLVQLEDGKTALATKLQIHSARATILIKFRDGRELEATPDHEVMIERGWCRAGHLKTGDRVVLWNRESTALATPPKRTSFDNPIHSVRRRKVKASPMPLIWSAELAELVGLFLAEGNKDSYRVQLTISSQEKELAQWIRDRVHGIFGLNAIEGGKAGKNVRFFRIYSFDVAANIHPLIAGTSRFRRIPSVLFELDDACIAGCLRGLLEGDGTVVNSASTKRSRSSPSVQLKTASVALARDVQLLLQRLGVASRIQRDIKTDCYAVRVSSRAAITRYADSVGFLTSVKRDKLAKAVGWFTRNTRNGFAQSAEVTEISLSSQEHVFDLTVPDASRFIANGLVVHNCGKSLTAKAIATAWGVPLLKVDLGAIKSKFVGESENNLRRAFRVIETVGRCVCWFDEIEKALQGATSGSADGGVSSDALGAVLSWMQERQGEAFVIATANDVSILPSELLRKGRFDEIWWCDLPTLSERADILSAALRSHGRQPTVDMARVPAACDGFTGSEIAAIVPDAMFAAFADGGREINGDDLMTAAKTVVPLSKTAAEKIAGLRTWAAGRARPAPSGAPSSKDFSRESLKVDFIRRLAGSNQSLRCRTQRRTKTLHMDC